MAVKTKNPIEEDLEIFSSWKILSRFKSLPRSHEDLLNFLRFCYGDHIRSTPIDQMPERQVYMIVQRVYSSAKEACEDIVIQDKEIALFHSLANYENALKKRRAIRPLDGNGTNAIRDIEASVENLEERVCIQLEDPFFQKNQRADNIFSALKKEYEN